MVLTLGMAVDANVLIYERTKEELRAGKSLGKAIADGYSNAFSAIFDSNLTSIITGIVLFYFGTGPIRWFRYDDDHRFVRFIPYSRVLDSYRL